MGQGTTAKYQQVTTPLPQYSERERALKCIEIIQHLSHEYSLRSDIPQSDYESFANQAAVRLIRQYSEDSEAAFSSYAFTGITNAMRNVLRLSKKHVQKTVSIDSMVVSDNTAAARTIEDNLALTDFTEQALSRLGDREQTIVCLYYGIGTHEHTLKEISAELGITFQRVGQIKTKALESLRKQFAHHAKDWYP